MKLLSAENKHQEKNAFLEQVVKSGSSVVQLSVTVLQFQVSVFGNVVCIVIMAFWLTCDQLLML